ncbi:MAG: imelysin family protein [Pseudomonadota bacterium]
MNVRFETRGLGRAARLLALCALLLTGCGAQPRPPEHAYRAFLDQAFEHLASDYDALAERARAQQGAVEQLCQPDVDPASALREAHAAFEALVAAWSRVEWLRLGPVATDHRYERLFYWPDRGLRGRRQLARFIAELGPGQLDRDGLATKSVALQGLSALEYVLYADPPTIRAESAQCVAARPMAALVSEVTASLARDWRSERTLAAALSRTDEPLSEERALGKTMQEAASALTLAADGKIGRAMGEQASAARPALAPFSRSSLAARAIGAMVGSLHEMLGDEFQRLLPEDSRYVGAGMLRELEDVQFHLGVLAEAGTWERVVRDEEHRKRLRYLRQPLLSAHNGLSTGLTGALGLSAGFNSTDGD